LAVLGVHRGFSAAAVANGVVPESLKLCLNSDVREQVRRQVREATRLGIRSTPSFYLGTVEPGAGLQVRKVLVGFQSLDVLSKALDDALSRFGSSQ
jgi:protein-disulfide isomerase